MRAVWSGVGGSHFIRFHESLLFVFLFIVFHGIGRVKHCIGRRAAVRTGDQSRVVGQSMSGVRDSRRQQARVMLSRNKTLEARSPCSVATSGCDTSIGQRKVSIKHVGAHLFSHREYGNYHVRQDVGGPLLFGTHVGSSRGSYHRDR